VVIGTRQPFAKVGLETRVRLGVVGSVSRLGKMFLRKARAFQFSVITIGPSVF
jgi:hypothetical protein